MIFIYIFRIEQIPNHVFVSLFELVYLNLNDNRIGKINIEILLTSIFHSNFRHITTANASINVIASIIIK
jgi:hypothetical protein